VRGNFNLSVTPDAPADNFPSGTLKADGLKIEGGLYISGNFAFNGKSFASPGSYPPAYNELTVNALPYCFPALMAYPEPSSGTIATWTPQDTPPMNGGSSKIQMVSNGGDYEEFINLNGLTFSEGETHLHHTKQDKELVTFNGAELGYRLHNCDFFQFSYDSAVRCTKFLQTGPGTPQIVSYLELR